MLSTCRLMMADWTVTVDFGKGRDREIPQRAANAIADHQNFHLAHPSDVVPQAHSRSARRDCAHRAR